MLGFLMALLAGAATPMIETPVARPLAQALSRHMAFEDQDLRVLAFIIAMIAAAFLCAIFNTGSALSLAVGGALGYFGMRLIGIVRRMIEGSR